MSASELEDIFAAQLDAVGLDGYVREYQAIPGRKFRFDFAWEKERLLVEINGGTYTVGAHSTGTGLARDYEKLNLAQLAGWRCLQFDGRAVKSGEAAKTIQEALEAAEF